MRILFFISLLLILWHNVIYELFLVIISIFDRRTEKTEIKTEELPAVSLIIAAHNEEHVIEMKIRNSLSLKYPKDRIEIIIASDSSSDKTNDIIRKYSLAYDNVKLLEISSRGGKLNAYNAAIGIARSEIIAFSDANTIWDSNALEELVKTLLDRRVSAACGKLIYTNTQESGIAYLEGIYWNIENMMKKGESKIYSLTALNGAIYAIRREDYIFLNPLYSHDLCLPLLLGRSRKRTMFVESSMAFERSGTTAKDEIKRKRRMFGRIYSFIFHNPGLFFNPLSYNPVYFFSVFSHRTIRYVLPLLHVGLFLSSIFLFGEGLFFSIIFAVQAFLLLLASMQLFLKLRTKPLMLPYYYLVFIASMVLGFFDCITGKIKPYWEIAATTRG